ncbi:hypothetical protein T484DRAFT_1904045, partial [Baffinella frigidus]
EEARHGHDRGRDEEAGHGHDRGRGRIFLERRSPRQRVQQGHDTPLVSRGRASPRRPVVEVISRPRTRVVSQRLCITSFSRKWSRPQLRSRPGRGSGHVLKVASVRGDC